MRGRGFTLLELLVALAVTLAISGMALPALWGRLAGAHLDSALGQFGASVVSIRAQAQERGAAVELVSMNLQNIETLGARELRVGLSDTGDDPLEEPGSGVRTLASLPAGIELSLSDPRTGPPVGFASEEAYQPVELTSSEPHRLAVFMPDGSVVTAGPVYMAMKGRVFELRFNRWTGGASFRELPPLDAGPRHEPEAPQDELPEDSR